jgi:hypothetical protein
MQRFSEYLAALSQKNISDDSVVVLMDAFDVLLFPGMRRIGEVGSLSKVLCLFNGAIAWYLKRLAISKAPIVSCVENGLHIDKAGLMDMSIMRYGTCVFDHVY